MSVRDELALSILASGLVDWVSLLAASSHARLLFGHDWEESIQLAVNAIRRLREGGLVRVGWPDGEGGFHEVTGDIESWLAEAIPRYRTSTDTHGEWQWYLWTENTPAGDSKAREDDAPEILRRLGTA
jgi:hypothetical protein